MSVTIICSINNRKYETNFSCDAATKEYVIADEAYRIAMMFAETQAIVKYGRSVNTHEFAEFLKDLDYNYIIRR